MVASISMLIFETLVYLVCSIFTRRFNQRVLKICTRTESCFHLKKFPAPKIHPSLTLSRNFSNFVACVIKISFRGDCFIPAFSPCVSLAGGKRRNREAELLVSRSGPGYKGSPWIFILYTGIEINSTSRKVLGSSEGIFAELVIDKPRGTNCKLAQEDHGLRDHNQPINRGSH